MSKLKDKVAIVTGASKGIGAGIARQLAADGAKVVVDYASSKSGADKVVADIEAAGGTVLAVGADVRNKAQVDALIKAAIDSFGQVQDIAPIVSFLASDDAGWMTGEIRLHHSFVRLKCGAHARTGMTITGTT